MSELQLKAYGTVDARDYIPGAEALQSDAEEGEPGEEGEGEEEGNDNKKDGSDDDWVDVSQSEDEWVNVSHSDDQVEEDDDGDAEFETDDEDGEQDEEGVDDDDGDADGSSESGEEGDSESSSEDDEDVAPVKRQLTQKDKKRQKRIREDMKMMRKKQSAVAGAAAEDDGQDETPATIIEERKKRAAAVSLSRILTDKDFAKIDAAQVKKHMEVAKSNRKRRAVNADETNQLLKRYFVRFLVKFNFFTVQYLTFFLKGRRVGETGRN